jgi:hypothetical protein
VGEGDLDPSCPDYNSLDYIVWVVCELHVNKAPHKTVTSLAKIKEMMGNLDMYTVVKASCCFRPGLRWWWRQTAIFLKRVLDNVHDFHIFLFQHFIWYLFQIYSPPVHTFLLHPFRRDNLISSSPYQPTNQNELIILLLDFLPLTFN